jgi:hypothetical protein
MVDLGIPQGFTEAIPLGVSADGSVLVGYARLSGFQSAWRWNVDEYGKLGFEVISGDYSGAAAVSGDGTVVVGSQGNEAFRWSATEGLIGLGALPGGESYATAVSADGSVVVGQTSSVSAGLVTVQAFRWDAVDGMVGLGILPGTSASIAAAVSGDGSVVVGTADNFLPFIWDAQHGMRSLPDLLVNEYGFDLSGWRSLGSVAGISADGLTIVGTGFPTADPGTTYFEAWIAYLPEPSQASLEIAVLVVLSTLSGRRKVERDR